MISGTKPSQRVASLERQAVWLERRTRELAELVDILDGRSGHCHNCGGLSLGSQTVRDGWHWDSDPVSANPQPEEDIFDWETWNEARWSGISSRASVKEISERLAGEGGE